MNDAERRGREKLGRTLERMALVYPGHGVSVGEAAGMREHPESLWFLPIKMQISNRMTFQTGMNRCEVTEAALTPINPLPRGLSPESLPEPE